MGEELTASDQDLLSYYGRKTPEEIEEITGISAMEVAQRTAEIVGKRDYLAEDAKIQLMLLRLDNMSAEVERRMGSMNARDLGPALNASRGALNSVIKALSDLRKDNQVDLTQIERVYSKQLVEIVDKAFERMVGRLSERFGIDAEDLEEEARQTILEVAQEHDAR